MTKNKVPHIRFKGFNEEWQEQILDELCLLITKQTGFDYSATIKPSLVNYKSNNTYSFIQNKDFEGTNINLQTDFYIPKNVAESFPRILIDQPSILVTISGKIGNIGFYALPEKAFIGGAVGICKLKNCSDGLTILYSLLSQKGQNYFKSLVKASSHANITVEDIRKIKVQIPILKNEQIKIGDYFQHLDKLIAQKEKKYQKLKQFKKAMLSKMFPKNGADTPEIRFQGFSGKWEEKKLGDIGKTFTGLSGKTKEDFGHGEGRFITYMNIFSNPISKHNLTEPIEIDDKQNEVQLGDVFFTTSSETPEEVGMTSIWMNEGNNIYLNSFCFGYRPEKVFDLYYLAYMLRSSYVRKKIIFLAQGISRYNISKNKVMEIYVPIPDIKEQEKIGNYFQKLDTQIELQLQEIEKLKNIKKASLSKMFV